MQHFKKSHDAMMVSEEDLNWAKSLVYNEWTNKWVANKAKPDYLSFFPPNTKKLKIDEKVAIFKFLGIDQTNNKHVLDIGAGQGHFQVLCNTRGHTTIGTEIPSTVEDLNDLYAHYNVNVIPHLVIKQQPIGVHFGKYDYITSLRVTFDHETGTVPCWRKEDWDFLKEDLFSHLNTNGILFLKTNLKYALKDPQQAAMASLGEPLPGWNSLTFILKKN